MHGKPTQIEKRNVKRVLYHWYSHLPAVDRQFSIWVFERLIKINVYTLICCAV